MWGPFFAPSVPLRFFPHKSLDGYQRGFSYQSAISSTSLFVEAGAPTRTATRGNAMIASRDKTWGAGVEYFHSENWDDILKYQGTGPGVGAASGTLKDKADGYSMWSDFKFADTWAIFARYDKLDYKYTNLLGVEQKIKDKYYNAGISYDVLKNLKLALAYKHNRLDGPFATPYHYKTDEVGFRGMLTF